MSSGENAPLRFDGQVAIITGAGRGMGSEHAKLLAKRGAKIVINDILVEDAQSTIAAIRAENGVAIAVIGSIAERKTAEEIVQSAIDHFGRIDILINNAGIEIKLPFENFTDEQFHKMLNIHLFGAWALTQLCWPIMKRQRYGRVIMVCSTSIYGMPENSAYMAAKGGLLGLGKALAIEGKEYGILVNCFGPSASTAMARLMVSDQEQREWMDKAYPAWATSPVVAWLAHQDCRLTGEFITAYGPRFGRLFLAETLGYASAPEDYTIESVRNHMEEGMDEEGYIVPKSTEEQNRMLMSKPRN